MDLRKTLGGIVLCVLLSVADLSSDTCVTRRCLASSLIAKDLLSQPQSPSCDLTVDVLHLQYSTIEVNTKKMHFSSQLTLTLRWVDPELAWDDKKYNVRLVVIPANKIWTPKLTVENAVSVFTKPISNDVVVQSKGSVIYKVVMHTTVKCTINLFNYPFVEDVCLVALNGWTNRLGCGLHLKFHQLNMTGGSDSEWITQSVNLTGESTRNYLSVEMTVSKFNPIVSLILPSVLILIADVMSCMLPLGGGERNSFKVTLVLSFTMFLLQLTLTLPDTENCSPLLRYHYLVSLLLLLQSMISSLVLTRMVGGCMFLCCWGKNVKEDDHLDWTQQDNGKLIDGKQENVTNTIQDDPVRKLVSFLKIKRQQEVEEKKARGFAEKLDVALFLVYISLCVIYGISLAYITTMDFCKSDNDVDWLDDDFDYD